jgi:hypothetical protein
MPCFYLLYVFLIQHIGQTIQTVLKHLVGIEGVKVPSESSNRRMILESNLLAKLQVGEKMLSHGLNTLHFDGTTEFDSRIILLFEDSLGTLTPSIPTKCLSTVCIV